MLNKEIASGLRILGSTRVISAILAFSINVIIVRTVSKLEYGNYQLSLSLINFWSFLSLTDLNIALVRAKCDNEILSIRNFRIIFSLIAGVVTAYLIKQSLMYFLVLIPLVALFYTTTMFNTVLLLNENYRIISRTKLLVPVIFISIFCLCKIIFKIDIDLLLMFLFSSVLAWVMLSIRNVNQVLNFQKIGGLNISDKSRRFVLWSVGNTMFLLLIQNIDKWAVTILLDLETLSVYMVGLSFAKQLNFIFKDTLDALTKAHKEKTPTGIKDGYILLFGSILGIVLAGISFIVLPKIYGVEYEKSAIVSATVFCFLGVYILVSLKSQSILFNADSEYKKYFLINILTAFISIASILCLFLVNSTVNSMFMLISFALLVPLNDVIRLALIKKIYER